MRKFFLLLALFFSLNISAQLRFNHPIIEIEPTELIATYYLSYQQDSLNPNFIREEAMLLFLGKTTSMFISNHYYMFDTIMRRISSEAEFDRIISDQTNPLPMSAILYRIFKNYPKGKLTCLEHTLDGTFKYLETLDLFSWKLTDDTITIAGYKAQKAITEFGGRSWIAWFSPEIPYNDGPYKFNGLPGLILKVHDTRIHYVFELGSIEKPKQKLMIDYKKKNFIETSKQDFFKAKDALRANIVNRVALAGADSKGQQNAALSMAERNNPIELERK